MHVEPLFSFLLLEFMWTRSRIRATKEDSNFRTLDAPKRKTLIKSKSLSSINNLEFYFKLVPFNILKMANPSQNIYLA